MRRKDYAELLFRTGTSLNTMTIHGNMSPYWNTSAAHTTEPTFTILVHARSKLLFGRDDLQEVASKDAGWPLIGNPLP
jgi:hypothetical protein